MGAPLFAADAVMHEKEAVQIVFFLDVEQSRIVRPPIIALPIAREEAVFGDMRAAIGRDFLSSFMAQRIASAFAPG